MSKKQSEYDKAHENFKCLKSHRIKTWDDLSLEEIIDLWRFFKHNEDLFPVNFVEIMDEFFANNKKEYDVNDDFNFL